MVVCVYMCMKENANVAKMLTIGVNIGEGYRDVHYTLPEITINIFI